MNVTGFLVAVAVIWLAYGVGFAVAPVAIWSLYGVTLDSAGILISRYLAASSLGLGLICWLERRAEADVLQGINIALFVTSVAGLIAALLGVLSGVVGPLGWGSVIILSLMALGHGYFGFVKPTAS
ncbi:MAG: hypothetical protein PVF54_10700 [Anaerolineae bacterium]|jgi:hypothetical protein